ncbi:MAG: 50S ribosomal protein L25 [Fibrobacter sp.]|nr:50S ribosomal protein L25 [Fibrobacter sp.]
MDIIKLKTRPRSGSGKSYTRKARMQGWVPAIYYGRNHEPVNIEVDGKEFATIVRTKKLTHLIDLGIGSNGDDSIAVIREVQRHVLKDNIFFHIDFQKVAMNEKVTIEVPVVTVGISVGVKENNGVLGVPVKKVTIECMPSDIPENITIDVSALDIGDSIHVRDVVVPNITIKEAPEEVLAVVTHATREEDAAKSEEAAEAGAAAPAAASSASEAEKK